jgi:hypothetical protein
VVTITFDGADLLAVVVPILANTWSAVILLTAAKLANSAKPRRKRNKRKRHG